MGEAERWDARKGWCGGRRHESLSGGDGETEAEQGSLRVLELVSGAESAGGDEVSRTFTLILGFSTKPYARPLVPFCVPAELVAACLTDLHVLTGFLFFCSSSLGNIPLLAGSPSISTFLFDCISLQMGE